MRDCFADIILPIASDGFTFRLDESLRDIVKVGSCVKVPLGNKRYYAGIVRRIFSEDPSLGTLKTVFETVPDAPGVSANQLRFWEWISSYYMCTLGEVMRAALPSALKPEAYMASDVSAGAYLEPETEYICFRGSATDREGIHKILDGLAKAPRQLDVITEILSLKPGEETSDIIVPRRQLSADSTVIKALVKKGIVQVQKRRDKPGEQQAEKFILPVLTKHQDKALSTILKGFSLKEVALLHGITGSGKTEIYIHLIARALYRGEDVIFLLPEIAMTSQLIDRMRKVFGERVLVYHSKMTPGSRLSTYRQVESGCGGRLILGVRSAVLLPFGNVSLIIVDEEHDPGYKQSESSPRYHARDCAIMLGSIWGARTLLGSATPSIESYANSLSGKYTLAELTERYTGVPLPRYIVSDTIHAVKRGERRNHFNMATLDLLADTLDNGRQAILFQNRRGFTPFVQCDECGWIASCPHCSVSMVYHRSDNSLRCHYCGEARKYSRTCGGCAEEKVSLKGFGTEKLEYELQQIFPSARIDRLDKDTATSRTRFSKIIDSFAAGATDILTGTQMVTKGFDFEGVSLVVVMNADNMLNFPDFRSSERAFQMITQAAGRAGRRQIPGTVVIQTSEPEHPVIRQVISNDYRAMVRSQLGERREFFYPPYCRLISVTMVHRDRELLRRASADFDTRGRGIFGKRLLGPQIPAVEKVRDEYRLSFLLKIERTSSFGKAKKELLKLIAQDFRSGEYKGVRFIFNVDPQ